LLLKSRFAIDRLKKDLSSEFEMKNLCEAKKVLGLEIERDQERWQDLFDIKGVFEEDTLEILHQR